ncbi:MAG: ABC transporter substrate-binding protein [Firmicutes bacterium]|nr:ABC transporter substrate-binding protein [Bacillota bacterium]
MKKIIALFCVLFLFGCHMNQSAKDGVDKEQTPAPALGGTLKIHSYNFDTLNPLFTKSKTNRQVLMLIYDFLIACDDNQIPHPILSSGFSVSDDALVWTVNINEKIRWHDGAYLTASDVAATLNAVRNSQADSAYKENLSNAKSIEAFADSVVITLKEPQTNFINLLEIPIVKAEDAPNKDIEKPIGTGCYIYIEKTHEIMYLTSNKTGRHLPYIENINVYLLPNKETSVFAFEAKEIDIAQTDMTGRGDFSGYAQSKAVEFNSGCYNFLAFNTENEHLSNLYIRKAIAHAISKKQIFEEALLSKGTLCNSFVHPEWQFYNEKVDEYEYNPATASHILAEQEVLPESIRFNILVNEENKLRVKVAKIIAQQLKTCGINAHVELLSWGRFKEQITNGKFDMYLGEINFSNELNPAYIVPQTEPFALLLQQLQAQTTNEGRKDLYNTIQLEYSKLLPAIPLYFSVESILLNNKIKGNIRPLRNNIFNNIHEWYIETEN